MAKFEAGKSGNPAGKPRGALSSAGRLRAAIAEDLPEIITVLRERALSGDVQAAALLLNRAIPALRPESASTEVASNGKTLSQRAEAIVAAVLAGEIPGDIANSFMSALVAQSKVMETDELLLRIERLETALNALNPGGRKP